MSKLIEMKIERVGIFLNSTPVVLLKEVNGDKTLPIFVGLFEAALMERGLQSTTQLSRPSSYDLTKNILDSLEISISKIVVHDLKDGVFFACVELKQGDRLISVDARPSDALNLATRTDSPIFVKQSVVSKALQETIKYLRDEADRFSFENLKAHEA